MQRLNDRYGHLSGDRVLASFGALARRSLRTLDLIGRYGGEEFALVVTDVTAAEAVALADRLREEFSTIEQQSIDGSSFQVTFSAGLAMLSDRGGCSALPRESKRQKSRGTGGRIVNRARTSS